MVEKDNIIIIGKGFIKWIISILLLYGFFGLGSSAIAGLSAIVIGLLFWIIELTFDIHDLKRKVNDK